MPFMQYTDRICEIERRAKGINLTLGVVARRAKVPFSTLWRWREGLVSPNTRTLDRHLSALERQIEAEVAAVERRVA